MVVSHLNKYIDYAETREIEEDDIEEETDIYETDIRNKKYYIAFGKPKYTFATKYDVVYFPIYLLKGFRKIRGKIGVIEMEKTQVVSVKDIGLGVLGKYEPLLFNITTESYLEKTMAQVKDTEYLDEDQDLEQDNPMVETRRVNERESDREKERGKNIEEENEDDLFSLKNIKTDNTNKNKNKEKINIDNVFTKDKVPPKIPSWPEETDEETKHLREEYTKIKSFKDNWVQKYTHNKHFGIQRNEGGGDCFFAVIRDAFLDIGYTTSVQKLRLLLSQEANSSLFQQYHDIYNGIVHGKEINAHEMDTISTMNQKLKKQAQKGGQTKSHLGEIIAGAKELQQKYTENKKQMKMNEDLLEEFGFMSHIKTLDDFKNFIRTSDYWADTWAISTLEILLNVKIIILEESSDKDAIMQCGQLNNDISTFSPKYYIIANYTNGNHYELITYKKKGLLTFQEIPFGIKVLIMNKCMERAAGPYAIIPAFRDFKIRLLGENEEEEEEEKEKDKDTRDELYEDDIVFVFHNRSDSNKNPGKGTGEKIPVLKIPDFALLQDDKNWRQKIDDDWSTIISVDHLRWGSVSHYLLAVLFKELEPDVYKAFSLDHTTDEKMAKDIDLARESIEKVKGKEGRFYSKYKKLPKRILKEEEDTDLQNARKEALMAKFTQNADLGTILRNTRKAKLIHFSRRNPGKADILMMEVRKKV